MSRFVSKLWSSATSTLISSRLQRKFQGIRPWVWRSSSTIEHSERLENYLHFGYFLLSWQQPIYTLAVCIVFNILFFFLVLMNYSIIRSIYWSFSVLILSDSLIENLIFKREFFKKHPIDPKVSIIIKNSVVMLAKGGQYLKQLYNERPDTVYVYMAFGFILSLLLLITLFNVVYFYIFVMVLFTGPILLSRYCPKLVKTLFDSIHVMLTTEDLKEEDLVPDENTTKDSDNDSISSDFSTDLYAGLIAQCSKMPSHLEVEEEYDEYDEIDTTNKHRNVLDFEKFIHDVHNPDSNDEAIITTDRFCSDIIKKTYEEIINEQKCSVNSRNIPQIQSDSSDSDFEIISRDEATVTTTSDKTTDDTKSSLSSLSTSSSI